MPVFTASPHDPVIVRSREAECLPEIGHLLLADASASNGALSAHRILAFGVTHSTEPAANAAPASKQA
jgi:hypothetical protein